MFWSPQKNDEFDGALENVYVLVCTFQDGENITIALDNSPAAVFDNKNSGIATEGNTNSGVTQSAPPLSIKLADFFLMSIRMMQQAILLQQVYKWSQFYAPSPQRAIAVSGGNIAWLQKNDITGKEKYQWIQ